MNYLAIQQQDVAESPSWATMANLGRLRPLYKTISEHLENIISEIRSKYEMIPLRFMRHSAWVDTFWHPNIISKKVPGTINIPRTNYSWCHLYSRLWPYKTKMQVLRLGKTCHHHRLIIGYRLLDILSPVTWGHVATTIISSTRLPNPFLITLHTNSQLTWLSVMS